MFDHTSRYYELPVATYVGPDGRAISYVTRRFLPKGQTLPLLAEVSVQQGERIDLIAHRTLGDSVAYWRVCDANNAMDPQTLTAEPGRRLRVPMPQTGTS
jgi:hypothetical protein